MRILILGRKDLLMSKKPMQEAQPRKEKLSIKERARFPKVEQWEADHRTSVSKESNLSYTLSLQAETTERRDAEHPPAPTRTEVS